MSAQHTPLERSLLASLECLAQFDSYETEYDGCMLSICPSCGKQDGEHSHNCDFTEARALIAKARTIGSAS